PAHTCPNSAYPTAPGSKAASSSHNPTAPRSRRTRPASPPGGSPTAHASPPRPYRTPSSLPPDGSAAAFPYLFAFGFSFRSGLAHEIAGTLLHAAPTDHRPTGLRRSNRPDG